MTTSSCDRCGHPVQPRNAWREVQGWEHPRTGGGTNHVALREHTGKLRCNGCMVLLQSGREGQMKLG